MTVPPISTTWPRAPYPDIPSHPLLVVDFARVKAGDKAEQDTLFSACSNLGFFYLENHGVEDLVEPMFSVGERAFAIPLEESLEYEMGDSGRTCGYKKAGGTNVDAKGNLDTVQFWNIAKDDALTYPSISQRSYPPVINESMANPITPFVAQSDEVLKVILDALEPYVGLAKGELRKLHKNGLPCLSGSEARIIYKPANGTPGVRPEGVGEDGKPSAAIGSHTDFGSFSMLHARGTGGLQVLPPGSAEWHYIKPLAGHAVCNVGDTLSVYTGGILRSNIHRVVPPPGDQALHTRWSLVFFLRPTFDEDLYPLVHLSEKIKDAAAVSPVMAKLEKGVTAGEWLRRRVYNQRSANRTGPETWKASRGTEHNPDRD